MLIMQINITVLYHMGLDATKPAFGVTNKARIKPVSPATETRKKIEISLVASLDIKLSNKRITKALISLRKLVCAVVVRKPPKTGFLTSRPIYPLTLTMLIHDISCFQ